MIISIVQLVCIIISDKTLFLWYICLLGRYPCLWCLILSTEMHMPKHQRREAQKRTLEGMQEHLRDFKDKGGGDLKKAKLYFNVIHEPLLEIPIDQVS